MLLGFVIIVIALFIWAIDFSGKLVTEDNYDILTDTGKRRKRTSRQQSEPQQQTEPTTPSAPRISSDPKVRDSVEVQEYTTVQGGENFQRKSPKDFIK